MWCNYCSLSSKIGTQEDDSGILLNFEFDICAVQGVQRPTKHANDRYTLSKFLKEWEASVCPFQSSLPHRATRLGI